MDKPPLHALRRASGESSVEQRRVSLRQQLYQRTGLDVAKCYQCGKCTAGCPMAEEMPLGPHQMIRLAQLGREQKLLSSSAPWLCLTCETCSERCPNQVQPARLIDGLRELAAERDPKAIPRRIRAFHYSFLDQIRKHGRVFEFGLVLSYKLRSGALLDDILQAPSMLAKGKLKLTPHSIEGIQDVQRIFEACLAEEKESEP